MRESWDKELTDANSHRKFFFTCRRQIKILSGELLMLTLVQKHVHVYFTYWRHNWTGILFPGHDIMSVSLWECNELSLVVLISSVAVSASLNSSGSRVISQTRNTCVSTGYNAGCILGHLSTEHFNWYSSNDDKWKSCSFIWHST